jgi:hypothetical protein
MSTVRFQEAIRSLTGAELSVLIGCLSQGVDENGVTGELLGVCLTEAVERLKNES